MEDNKFNRAIIDNLPDALFVCNQKGEILDVNETACARLGFSIKELKSLNFKELISKDSIAEFDANFKLLIEKKQFIFEVEHVDKAGTLKPAELSLKIINENNDNIVLIVSRDITSLKECKQTENSSEELYRKLFELANEAIYVVDHKGYSVLANSHCVKMTGYSKEELKSNPIINLVYPEDRAHVTRKLNERLSGDAIGYAYSFRIIDKKGNIKWVYQNSIGTLWDGKPAGLCVSSDITELKNIEAALRESEEKYRLVVENANEGIFIIQDERVVFSNKYVRNILGYNDEEFKNEHFINLIHPDDKKVVFENYRKRIEGEFIPMYISRVKKKTGSYVTVEVRATKIIYEGKPATLNFTTDVTEKLNAENKLQENEERYHSFFSNSIEAISIFDVKTMKFLDVNDAFCQMYGYTKDEALTMVVSDVSAEPEISEQAIKNSAKKGSVDIPIRYHKKKDGTIMIVRISAGPFQWKGRKVMYSILRDITEQLKTEQELIDSKELLQTMADSVPAYVAVVDAETLKYKFVNQRFVDAYEREREQIIGSHIKDIISEENTEFAMKYINEVRKGNPSSYINVFKINTGERYIHVNYRPSFHSNGKVKDIIVLSHDITDLKNAEKQLQKAKEEAEFANQVKSELIATKNRFFSIIAHDLKSPFSGLIGLSQLLVKNASSEKDCKRIAALINDAAINGFKLLENLLEWARTQTGAIKYNPEKVDLKKIIEFNVSLLRQNAKEKNIIMSEIILDEIIIEGDKQMINTIIRNLVSNAIKFTPKGGSVTIEAAFENGNVNLSVSDTGIGINQKDMQKLFKIGGGFSNSGTEDEKGTGLGLILCKEFVDKHSGSIKVESEVLKGTKIIVKLPRSNHLRTT